MKTTTVYTLKNADFTGMGLPSILPFVAQNEAEYAFDFRKRANRLNDLTGKHADLVPKRNDIVAGILQVEDPTIVFDQDNGAGIRLELGFLETDELLVPVPIDGSVRFTIMVVGGWSGVVTPPEKLLATGNISNLYDYGTRVSPNGGFAIDDTKVEARVGARVKAGGTNMPTQKDVNTRKCLVFLTYDGAVWTFYNRTMGLVSSKTNAELGITAPLPVITDVVQHTVMGHYHNSSTLTAFYPALYQMAKWNRVLTQAEMDAQHAQSKLAFPFIGI